MTKLYKEDEEYGENLCPEGRCITLGVIIVIGGLTLIVMFL